MVHEIGNRTYIVARCRAARPRRRPHDAGRHGALGGRVRRCCSPSTAGSRTTATCGGCGPAWPASASAWSGWDHCRRRRKRRARADAADRCAGLFYTATTLDGFIADEHDSLAWLFEQEIDEGGPGGLRRVHRRHRRDGDGLDDATSGSRDHMERTGEAWAYDIPCWVFTHRDLEPLDEDIRFVAGEVEDHHAAIAESAGDRDSGWSAAATSPASSPTLGHLAPGDARRSRPVTLGAGRPLFPRRHDLKLVEVGRNGDFVVATYDVRRPGREATRTPRGRRG